MRMPTPTIAWLLIVALAAGATPVAARAQQDEGVSVDSALSASALGHNLPSGYLGITFTCKLKSQWGSSGLAITHYGYPAVASVEPDSPAERAGIQAGDTILAYDAQDVRNRIIVLNKLLRPNSRLAVRLRRNGQVRDVAVVIARRPTTFVGLADVAVAPMAPVPDAPMPPTAPMPPVSRSPAARAPDTRAPETVVEPRVATEWWSRRLLGPDFVADDNDLAALAGAEVVRTTPDLREALGISGGLLVVAVGAGTPAAESTLRAGDVIISAGGSAMTTPMQLARAIDRGMARGHSVALQVERQHRTRRVELKW